MATKAQNRKERSADRAFRISVISLIAGIILPLSSLAYTVLHDHSTYKSNDSRFSRLETALRLLTAAYAPSIEHELDESLRSAIEKKPELVKKSVQQAHRTLSTLQDLDAPLSNDYANAISASLGELKRRAPDSPDVWNAAITFVSYRTGLQKVTEERLNCFDQPGFVPGQHVYSPQQFHDCAMNLGDFSGFEKHRVLVRFDNNARADIKPQFVLRKVTVTIPSGALIPISSLRCEGCAFRSSETHDVPSAQKQALIQTLLASNPSDVLLSNLA